MKTPHRFALAAGLLLSGLLASCTATSGNPSSHWNVDSVDNRIVKHFTGYRGAIDGSYLEHQYGKKMEVRRTFRRHFLNANPDNPFQGSMPLGVAPRGPYGPLPDPVLWFSAESIVIGGALLAWTGTFIPIPVDSVLAIGSDGGGSEFVDSITFDWDPVYESPPRPSSFEVKNR